MLAKTPLLRGYVGTGPGEISFAGPGPLPVLVETTVPGRFVILVGVVVLGGFVGTRTFLFVDTLLLARFAHVLPQYGCTTTPSLYLGFFLQCLGR